jgi:hypothetical protein
MAIEKTIRYAVGDCVFEDEALAKKYDALMSKEGEVDKIVSDCENSVLPYLKGMSAGSRVIIRDWKAILGWEFHRRGYVLPDAEAAKGKYMPKSVEDYAKEVAKATNLAKGDSTEVPPTNVPGQERPAARAVA